MFSEYDVMFGIKATDIKRDRLPANSENTFIPNKKVARFFSVCRYISTKIHGVIAQKS